MSGKLGVEAEGVLAHFEHRESLPLERAEDVLDRPAEFMTFGPDLVARIGIVAFAGRHDVGGLVVEVAVLHPGLGGGLVEHHLEGVAVEEVKEAASREVRANGRGPAVQVLQPDDGAQGRENHVEVPALDTPCFRDVALEEGGALGETGTLGEMACGGDRGIGKVDADRAVCTQSDPGQRVHADMTLQVEQALAGEVAHRPCVRPRQA